MVDTQVACCVLRKLLEFRLNSALLKVVLGKEVDLQGLARCIPFFCDSFPIRLFLDGRKAKTSQEKHSWEEDESLLGAHLVD